jgi:mannose/fructose/N-acetylgalactosamine-specific phosphotransferase system component IIC
MSDELQSQQPNPESPATDAPLSAESEQTSHVEPVRRHTSRTNATAAGIGVAGWILPGLGHALQKMWGRAAACFLAVGFLVVIGSGMRGNLFQPQDADAFGRLGYIADVGTGSFYWLAKWLEIKGPDVSRADGDYGTRFLAAAGVLNLLAALHAYEAARGRKA